MNTEIFWPHLVILLSESTQSRNEAKSADWPLVAQFRLVVTADIELFLYCELSRKQFLQCRVIGRLCRYRALNESQLNSIHNIVL
jgi:hypothetical protein